MPDNESSHLRQARKRHFSSIRQFADALADEGLTYSTDAVGYWERLERFPDRNALLTALKILVERDAIVEQATIMSILEEFDQRPVTDDERERYALHLNPVIENLPEKPPYDVLIGRDQQIDDLREMLTAFRGKQVVVLSGLGGIGKTALAYEAVSRLMRNNHFDHLLWATAKIEEFTGIQIETNASTVSLNLRSVLASYAQQLGLNELVNQSQSVLEHELRRVFQQAPHLIVLDNLETLKSAREAAKTLYEIVSNTPSRVLITSRKRLVDEGYLVDYFLQGLSEGASLKFLRLEAENRGATALLTASDALMRQVYDVTAGMPLALKLIVSQFLLGVALDEELARLAGVEDERELYKFIYYSIWKQLSIGAKKILVGAATFAAPALRDMLMTVSQSEPENFVDDAQELIRMSLLWTIPHPLAAKMRYDMHAMTRWFVNSPLQEQWRSSQ